MNTRPIVADPLFRWEDAEIGARERSQPYVITREEMLSFARRFDPLPIHVDAAAAELSQFGGLTAAGCHMLAIRQRLLYDFAFPGGVVASIGYDEVRFLAPLRAGQTCIVEIEFLEKRPSKSRADRGVLVISNTLLADDIPILTLKDIGLVKRREAPI
jgi:acyl dehydratase